MKAILVPSFAEGQHIITTPDPTDHRGRVAIAVPCGECDDGNVHPERALFGFHDPCPACNGLGSLIVASAVATDCVPIRCRPDNINETVDLPGVFILTEGQVILARTGRDWSYQPPYADFTPGRWAWLLDDVQPTSVRCPGCWGLGGTSGSIPYAVARWRTPCLACNGAGHCPPIPVKAEPGLWEWTP